MSTADMRTRPRLSTWLNTRKKQLWNKGPRRYWRPLFFGRDVPSLGCLGPNGAFGVTVHGDRTLLW